jgi:hypothetical protein
MPATEMELLDLPHNDYPGVWFQREFLSSRGLDSRSWAELLGAAQSSIKDLSDSFNNHASLTAVPTLIAKGRRSTARMKIGQLEVINLKPQGDVKAMDMGRFPSAAVQQGELTRRDADALAANHIFPIRRIVGRVGSSCPSHAANVHAAIDERPDLGTDCVGCAADPGCRASSGCGGIGGGQSGKAAFFRFRRTRCRIIG